MTKRGSALGSVFKWAIVPIGLAALGFYVVGPKVAAAYTDKLRTSLPEQQEPEAPEKNGPPTSGAPKVQIKSQRVTQDSAPHRTRRRRSRPSSGTSENLVRVRPADPPPANPPSNDDNEGPGAG